MKFHRNTKCIAILFGQKLYIYIFIDICSNIQSSYCKVKLRQTNKLIALLFGQKSIHLSFHRYL